MSVLPQRGVVSVRGVLWVLSQLWADAVRYLFYTLQSLEVSFILLERLSLFSFPHCDVKNTLETTEYL